MPSIIEPTIVINGFTLNTGEAMTLRVALENWTLELRDDPGCLGVDEHARRMRDGYLAALGRIHQMIARSQAP